MSSIRGAYEEFGAEEYYRRFGADYRNPHEIAVRAVIQESVKRNSLELHHVLDLACGSGEATRALLEIGASPERIDGVDPYTAAAYSAAIGIPAEELSFEDVAAGALAGRSYSLTVCSFALHLADVSRLPLLAWQLAEVSDTLLIVTPHKRPDLRPEWGWRLVDEFVLDRVRARVYLSHRNGEGEQTDGQ